MTQDADTIIRVSVVHADRRIDLAVPGQLPLIELIPGMARSLGVLDPTLVHGGYGLIRANGRPLSPTGGALAQGITPGEVLTLMRGELVATSKVYDDVVEAVIDASADQHGVWRPEDAARTATAVSLTLLALCALVLTTQGPGNLITALIAAAGTAVLLTLTATLGRLGQQGAGIAFGISASVFAGLTGYLLVPAGDLWGWPLAAAGLGAVLGGALAMLIAVRPIEYLVAPMTLGLALGIPAAVHAAFDAPAAASFAVAVAACGALAGSLPWLALASTRITVLSPQSEQEMFDTPEPINAERVAERIRSGQRLLIALRLALGLTILAAIPLVAAESWAGAILSVLCGAVLMFQSRQSGARGSVLALLTCGTAIVGAAGLVTLLAHPEQTTLLLIVLITATALVVGLTLLSDRVRLRLSTLADTVEIILLTLLLPLGVIAAGIA
ncbi:type VII secretion integral membrane protein EccD [Mycetocola spongiae]|uniref:type VII secretion integral membrane protein EccD n=1 Tax=Mycetocola spongiae TaxID=2859226 RepID=UPI001CF48664|nr:type VII secretion integral membrane protein EccD [Mycetocola spongiae]UCR90379.1 type VII secretion integral membrane protein EccD [Mycetocola spongiae]